MLTSVIGADYLKKVRTLQGAIKREFRGHHVEVELGDHNAVLMHIHASGFSMCRSFYFDTDGRLTEDDDSYQSYDEWRHANRRSS